ARPAGGAGAVTRRRRGARAGELSDAARRGRDARLAGGTGAGTRGRRGAGARQLADAARGGRDARLPGRTGAVTRRRGSARARQLADAARGGRHARLAGGAGAVTRGRRGAGARQRADAARGRCHARLPGGAGAATGGSAALARRNADVAREGEWDGPQRALVDAGCSGQVGQRVGVAGEHREVRTDAGLARGADRAHRRPALGGRHAELARRLAAVGVEWHVALIAQLPEDGDGRPARGGGARVLRHAELVRVELAVRAHATDPAATVK